MEQTVYSGWDRKNKAWVKLSTHAVRLLSIPAEQRGCGAGVRTGREAERDGACGLRASSWLAPPAQPRCGRAPTAQRRQAPAPGPPLRTHSSTHPPTHSPHTHKPSTTQRLPSPAPNPALTLAWLQGPAAGVRSKLGAGPLLHSAAASFSQKSGPHLHVKSKFADGTKVKTSYTAQTETLTIAGGSAAAPAPRAAVGPGCPSSARRCMRQACCACKPVRPTKLGRVFVVDCHALCLPRWCHGSTWRGALSGARRSNWHLAASYGLALPCRWRRSPLVCRSSAGLPALLRFSQALAQGLGSGLQAHADAHHVGACQGAQAAPGKLRRGAWEGSRQGGVQPGPLPVTQPELPAGREATNPLPH